MKTFTGIIRIELSGDVADYGHEATEENIREYISFLSENTDCEDISINCNSNAESWEFDEGISETDGDEMKSDLWEAFCSMPEGEKNIANWKSYVVVDDVDALEKDLRENGYVDDEGLCMEDSDGNTKAFWDRYDTDFSDEILEA